MDEDKIFCSFPDCEHFVKNHKWGFIKAEGWFFKKRRYLILPRTYSRMGRKLEKE